MSRKTPRLITVLLIEPDDTVPPILKENLQRWGYAVIVILGAANALQRIQNGSPSFDLILMNQCGQSIDHFLEIGRHIRQQSAFSSPIPIVIMAGRIWSRVRRTRHSGG